MNMFTRIAIGLLVATLGPWAVAQPEPGPPPPSPGPAHPEQGPGMGPRGGHMRGPEGPGALGLEDRDTRELVEAVMMAKLAEELGLNDEQTVLMFRRFREQKQQAAELGKQRQEALKALKDTIKAGAADNEIEAALTKLIEADKAIGQARLDIFKKTGEDLTVTQRAKLYVFTTDFERQMRDLIGKARERRARMMWGGPEEREKGPVGPGPGEARPWRGEQGRQKGFGGEGGAWPWKPATPPASAAPAEPPAPPAERPGAPRVE